MSLTQLWIHVQVHEKHARFEREVQSLPLHLTPEVLQTIAHFDVALSRNTGAVLALGSCGSGCRATAALVAHAHLLTFRTPPCPVNYGQRHFHAFLKDCLRSAGIHGNGTLMCLEDHHLATPAALADINSLLASGEVPGLFSSEEAEKEVQVLADVRAATAAHSIPLWDFFVARVRKVGPACPVDACISSCCGSRCVVHQRHDRGEALQTGGKHCKE
jgi:dynein heavy chain 2, cytosolic